MTKEDVDRNAKVMLHVGQAATLDEAYEQIFKHNRRAYDVYRHGAMGIPMPEPPQPPAEPVAITKQGRDLVRHVEDLVAQEVRKGAGCDTVEAYERVWRQHPHLYSAYREAITRR